MSNVNRMYFKINAYDVVAVDPARKPVLGELAAIIYADKIILSRVVKNMQGIKVFGRPMELQRSYMHGEPPLTIFDADRSERIFYYNLLKPFEQILYRGLLKAETLRNFPEYYKAETYFFERINRRRRKQEGVQ